MFELTTLTKAKLSSVNVRSEMHGKDHVPAVDLKFTLDAGNDMLDAFDTSLLTALYTKAAASDESQASLDGVAPVSTFPNLRFPKLAPLAWDTEQSGMALTIDYGLGGASNLELQSCTANAFKIAPKEGGTVEVSFRVQRGDMDEKTIGKLATLVQHDVHIVLTAPEPVQESMDDEPEAPKKVRQTPEQALAAQLGLDGG